MKKAMSPPQPAFPSPLRAAALLSESDDGAVLAIQASFAPPDASLQEEGQWWPAAGGLAFSLAGNTWYLPEIKMSDAGMSKDPLAEIDALVVVEMPLGTPLRAWTLHRRK